MSVHQKKASAWLFLTLPGLVFSSACADLIGADFDPKTVDPDYFAEGGESPQARSTGGASNSSGGSDGAGGAASGGSASGGEASGGEGSGGDGSGTGGGDSGTGGSGGTGGTGGSGGMGTGGDGSGGMEACQFGDPGCDFDVVINEVRGQGGDDFIELYNRGTDIVDLVGCAVTDGEDRPDFPPGSLLAPGEYWLTWAINADAVNRCSVGQERCNTSYGWAISAGGELVTFRDPSNNNIETLNYPEENPPNPDGLVNGQTLGRSPDGGATIGALVSASPGAPNASLQD